MAKPLILVAEDEAVVAMLYAELFGAEGYRIRMVMTAADGIRAAQAEAPAAAVVDLRLRDGARGWILAEGLARRGVPVIVATAYSAELPKGFMERVQPTALLHKPIEPRELLTTVRAALASRPH